VNKFHVDQASFRDEPEPKDELSSSGSAGRFSALETTPEEQPVVSTAAVCSPGAHVNKFLDQSFVSDVPESGKEHGSKGNNDKPIVDLPLCSGASSACEALRRTGKGRGSIGQCSFDFIVDEKVHTIPASTQSRRSRWLAPRWQRGAALEP